LLEAKDVSVRYDTATVLDGASLKVEKGELVGLVGPNGAGKTTLLRAIAGLINWDREMLKGTRMEDVTFEGTVEFEGERIDRLSAYEIAKRGLQLCPQMGRPFVEMSVKDNLLAGAHLCNFFFVSQVEGEAEAAIRHSVRWRTADAGCRTVFDAPAEVHAC